MKCKSILVVEDNDDIREAIEEVLRSEGYRVYAVSQGQHALRALKSIPGPTLILLDMMMPQMNGWEFLRAQASEAGISELPVIVVTALDVVSALTRPGNESFSNAAGYIRKPIEVDTLLRTVRAHCDIWEHRAA